MKPKDIEQATTFGRDLAETITGAEPLQRQDRVRAAVFTLASEIAKVDNGNRDKPLKAEEVIEWARTAERAFALRAEQLTEM